MNRDEIETRLALPLLKHKIAVIAGFDGDIEQANARIVEEVERLLRDAGHPVYDERGVRGTPGPRCDVGERRPVGTRPKPVP